jgi:signal transduction histidine kinase
VHPGREDDNGPVTVNRADLARTARGLRQRAGELVRPGELLRPTRSLPALTARMWYFDIALALVLAAIAVRSVESRHFGATEVFPAPDGGEFIVPGTAGVPLTEIFLAVSASLPLALRRKYPLTVFWIVLVSTLKLDNAPSVLFFTVIISAYTATAYSPYRRAAIGSLGLAAVLIASTLRSTIPPIPNAVVPFVILLPIAWIANSMRSWKQQAAASLARLRAVEEGQERATREAVELERARIARELHDVVTHNVSVMVVQAGAARKVMDAAPERATQALLAVEASGRTAMAELRQVMGLLTSAADGSDEGLSTDARFEPQPDLDRLEALVGRVREVGVPVTLTVTGSRRPLPPGVGLAAYRVVQDEHGQARGRGVGAGDRRV